MSRDSSVSRRMKIERNTKKQKKKKKKKTKLFVPLRTFSPDTVAMVSQNSASVIWEALLAQSVLPSESFLTILSKKDLLSSLSSHNVTATAVAPPAGNHHTREEDDDAIPNRRVFWRLLFVRGGGGGVLDVLVDAKRRDMAFLVIMRHCLLIAKAILLVVAPLLLVVATRLRKSIELWFMMMMHWCR